MITYQEEIVTDHLINEIDPLINSHYDEISLFKDIELDPDYNKYKLLSQISKLKIYTARDDGELIGYAIYMVDYNIHYKKSLQAVQDILYMRPDKRKGRIGIKLIEFSEVKLKSLGVELIHQHIKVDHDFSPVLEKRDYKWAEKILVKRI